MIVVDANVVVYLLTPGPRTADAERLMESDPEWRVPRLWRSEVRNALLGHVRRGDFSLSHAIAIMAEGEALLASSEMEVSSDTVLALALRAGVSAYDCEYAALAMELGVAFISADQKLVTAFPESGRPL